MMPFWGRLWESSRKLAKLPATWGPLLVSLLVAGVYLSTVIANMDTEPDGAAAAAFALITATAVFARTLEGGSRIKWRALVTRINAIVVTWAGYSAALIWLLSETGSAMELQYRLVGIVAVGVGTLASFVIVARGMQES